MGTEDLDSIHQYVSGDTALERKAVEALRRLGEAAGRRLRLQPSDLDSLGVDFAAFMLTQGSRGICNSRGHLSAYLWRAARWFSAKQARSLRAWSAITVPLSVEMTHPGTSPVEALLARSHLLECLERLPATERKVFNLCLVEGRSCAEAAPTLGCSAAAARKRLERLRRTLRQHIF